MVKRLLPRFADVLADDDPIPVFAVRLLSFLSERNPVFVAALYRLNLVPVLVSFLAVSNTNNTIHSIRLVQRVFESPDVDRRYTLELGLCDRVVDVLAFCESRAVASFLEPLLDLCYSVLFHAHEIVRARGLRDADASACLAFTEDLLRAVPTLARLAAHDDAATAESSARSLNILSRLFPSAVPTLLFTRESLAQVAAALAHARPSPNLAARRLLKVLLFLAQDPDAAALFPENMSILYSPLEALSLGAGGETQDCARTLIAILSARESYTGGNSGV